MATRTFTNNGSVPFQFPTLGIEILPGKSADVEWPDDQPTPDGLTEATSGSGGSKRRSPANAPRSPAPSSPPVSEPDSTTAVTEPGGAPTVKEP